MSKIDGYEEQINQDIDSGILPERSARNILE